MNSVSRNIRKIREEAGLSQQALADRVIVTRQSISNWERGVSLPDIEMLASIADALGVEITELLYGKRPPDEFRQQRPARIRTALLLGVIWLVLLAAVCFLLPAMEAQARLTYQTSHYMIARTALLPPFYALTAAGFAAVLAINSDFRIKDHRICLLFLSGGILLFLLLFLYFAPIVPMKISILVSAWILKNPALFALPGTLLFCGCNRKPAGTPDYLVTTDTEKGDAHDQELS